MLTPFDLEERLEKLQALRRTAQPLGLDYVQKWCARAERDFYHEVLLEIASGNCPDPKTLSKTALRAREILGGPGR